MLYSTDITCQDSIQLYSARRGTSPSTDLTRGSSVDTLCMWIQPIHVSMFCFVEILGHNVTFVRHCACRTNPPSHRLSPLFPRRFFVDIFVDIFRHFIWRTVRPPIVCTVHTYTLRTLFCTCNMFRRSWRVTCSCSVHEVWRALLCETDACISLETLSFATSEALILLSRLLFSVAASYPLECCCIQSFMVTSLHFIFRMVSRYYQLSFELYCIF